MTKEKMLLHAKSQIKTLSPEYKRMWDELISTHPWIKRDNSELSNSENR
ncbi:MAG: hypothetical protein ACKPE3_30800 [Sphaerospermopsis kisseleviana]